MKIIIKKVEFFSICYRL